MSDYVLKIEKTNRNFKIARFQDANGAECSLQKSSLATKNCIWFGCNDLGLKMFVPGSSWLDVDLEQAFPQADSFISNTRMQLAQDQIQQLLPILQHFAEYGDLPNE